MKIAVAGTGYVGLSIATLLSQHHEVMAVDIIPEKVDLINRRKSPIQDEYIEKYLAEKDLELTATLDAEAAYRNADFVVIAAPTNYDSKKNFFDTSAVETVVLLSHKKADSYIHIDVEFGEGEGKIPVDSIAKRAEAYKPKEKVTYKMIKEYIEAKYGFKVHTAYIAEVKRNLGLPMYDAPNAVEELKQPRKHPTPEKVEAIKDALRYFAVI